MKHTLWLVMGGVVIAGSLVLGVTAFAQAASPQMQGGTMIHNGANGGRMMSGVFGAVSAITGNTLTVTSRAFGHNPMATSTNTSATSGAATTYTVDASNATVTKNNATSTLGAVSIGDTVFVQGTVSGSSVTATAIRDGVVPMMGLGGMHGPGPRTASGTWFGAAGSSTMAHFQGNGQPVVGGNVTAISGNTLTVTTSKDAIVYTIDASAATIEKGGTTSTISNVAVGDDVLVQGSVSGTSVTASAIFDQGTMSAATSTSNGGGKGFGGFISAVGGLFHRIFGFF